MGARGGEVHAGARARPQGKEPDMITLHRLGHCEDSFQLNPDLIVLVESTPDTVVTLTTGAKVVVAEAPEEIADEVRRWRAEVLHNVLHPEERHGQGVPIAAGR
jgi:uncharacterized protein YlzI (FlbEa/FlbD family)